MDYETNSDDLTSSENMPIHEPIVCSFCKLSTCKIDVSINSCSICLVKYCDSCGFSSKSLCKSCNSYLSSISTSSLNYVQSLRTKNQILSQRVNSLEKLSRQQQTLNVLAAKVADSQNNLNNLIQRQEILAKHKLILPMALALKDEKIEELDKKLIQIKISSQEYHKNRRFIKNYADVYMENQELLGKIKDLEQEHYLYTLQIIEGLEMVKIKILEENGDQKQSHVEKYEKEKELVTGNEELLRKELEEISFNLQRFREKKENFEQTVADDEQPDCRPCKCLIC